MLLGAVLVWPGAPAVAQILLHDDFSAAGAVNPAVWTVTEPFVGSEVTVSGGSAHFEHRGSILSVTSLGQDVQLSAQVRFGASPDEFLVFLRTDGQVAPGNSWGDRRGVLFEISRYFPDNPSIGIYLLESGSDYQLLASKSYSVQPAVTYEFTATANGSSLSLAINGVVELTATNGASFGGQVFITSSDLAGAVTHLDAVTVAAVPEPMAVVLFAGCAGLVAVLSARHRAKRGLRRR